jgi:hypothetical protein
MSQPPLPSTRHEKGERKEWSVSEDSKQTTNTKSSHGSELSVT